MVFLSIVFVVVLLALLIIGYSQQIPEHTEIPNLGASLVKLLQDFKVQVILWYGAQVKKSILYGCIKSVVMCSEASQPSHIIICHTTISNLAINAHNFALYAIS